MKNRSGAFIVTVLYPEGLGYDEIMMMRLLQQDVEMNNQADIEIQRNFFNVETYLQHL